MKALVLSTLAIFIAYAARQGVIYTGKAIDHTQAKISCSWLNNKLLESKKNSIKQASAMAQVLDGFCWKRAVRR